MGKLTDLIRDVSGANLEPCTGKTAPGVRCKKKKKPGYDSCGDPKCDSIFGAGR